MGRQHSAISARRLVPEASVGQVGGDQAGTDWELRSGNGWFLGRSDGARNSAQKGMSAMTAMRVAREREKAKRTGDGFCAIERKAHAGVKYVTRRDAWRCVRTPWLFGAETMQEWRKRFSQVESTPVSETTCGQLPDRRPTSATRALCSVRCLTPGPGGGRGRARARAMTVVSKTARGRAGLSVRFLGGAGTVTGSKFLVEAAGVRVLVDCGLYQGLKQLRLRNWARLPVEPSSIDAIVLTHAHIDHSGQLPLFVKRGFRGPIYATAPTVDLCGILLPDSGRIQEEDAAFANRRGFSKHQPALALYTEDEARRVLPMFVAADLGSQVRIGGALTARFQRAGHILGAASIEIEAAGCRVLFSGDLGRSVDPICPPPDFPGQVDALVMESTYGDRLHAGVDVAEALAAVLDRAVAESGTVLVPAFAVGRAQAMLYWLDRIFESGRVRRLPVFVDSPMASSVTELYRRHAEWHRLSRAECDRIFGSVRFTRSVEESKSLASVAGPAVLISASGMLTGGRVLHHFKRLAPEAANTILLAGFQAPGTRGGALAAGAKELKMHGVHVPVRARVEHLDALSAHADQAELLAWLRGGAAMYGRVWLVHGEAVAADALRRRIEEDLKLRVSVAEAGGRVTLGMSR